MTNVDANRLFATFAGHEGSIISFVMLMQQHDLTPADVLQMYDQYIADLRATMLPPPDLPAPDPPDTRRPEGQADTEYRLGACPRCGAEVWAIKKCPHISPPWRTFLACDADDCGYHGRSRLTVDVLRRQWPVGVEED